MDVGDALADDVVEGEERPVGAEGVALGGGHPPPASRSGPSSAGWQRPDGGGVPARDDQGVALEHRAGVEEAQELGFVEHQVGRPGAGDDLVEDADVGWGSRPASVARRCWPWPTTRLCRSPPVRPRPCSRRRRRRPPPGCRPRPCNVRPGSGATPWRRWCAAHPDLPGRLGPPGRRWPATTWRRTPTPGSATTAAWTPCGAPGWRGSGYVRWEHRTNRGFLRALDALRAAAAAIGEEPEARAMRPVPAPAGSRLGRRPADQPTRLASSRWPASRVRSDLFPTVPTPRPTTAAPAHPVEHAERPVRARHAGAPAGAT